MTNRKLVYIIKDQKPLVLAAHETVQHACRCMRERRAGSVLVIDEQQCLSGIFTGRDAVRTLAEGENGRIWGIVSRGDFKGMEIDQLDEEDHLMACIRW